VISLPDLLSRAIADLQECGAEFAVVGGLAVGVHSEPRFTSDVDLAILSADDQSAEQLTVAMFQRGYQLVSQLENKPSKRLRAVRLKLAREENCPLVDLLFAASGIEPEVVHNAVVAEVFPGISAPVARPAELIAMKLLASDNHRRHFDNRDMVVLIREADSATIEIVRNRLGLIESRGWNRSRDLNAELEILLQKIGWPDNIASSEFEG
jgi:hypothetical protein